MRNLYLLFLMLGACMLLGACRAPKVDTRPFEVLAPDSLPDPLPVNGWEFRRTSAKGGAYFPPQPPPRKVKNSYNTDAYNKKSGNTDSFNDNKKQGQQQNVGNAKKSGNEGSLNRARNGAAVGGGNKVSQAKGIPPLLIYLVILVVLLFVLWPRIQNWRARE